MASKKMSSCGEVLGVTKKKFQLDLTSTLLDISIEKCRPSSYEIQTFLRLRTLWRQFPPSDRSWLCFPPIKAKRTTTLTKFLLEGRAPHGCNLLGECLEGHCWLSTWPDGILRVRLGHRTGHDPVSVLLKYWYNLTIHYLTCIGNIGKKLCVSVLVRIFSHVSVLFCIFWKSGVGRSKILRFQVSKNNLRRSLGPPNMMFSLILGGSRDPLK